MRSTVGLAACSLIVFPALAVVALPRSAAAQTAPTYFVSPSGNDANAGTSVAPWRTIQKAANTAVAGSTVNVRAGTYREKVTVNVSGSASAGYITFQSAPGELAVVDGTGLSVGTSPTGLFFLNGRSYIRIKGFDIKNLKTTSTSQVPVGIHLRGRSHHVEILNNKIHHIESNVTGGNAHGIAAYGTDASQAITDLVIDGNEVWALKLGWSESVVVNGNVNGFTITNNLIHDNNNIGIDAIGFEGTCSTSTCDQARNGTIAGNRLYNISTFNNNNYREYSSAAIYVDGGTNILVERNVVSSSDFGVEIASEHAGRATSNVTVRSNLLYRNHLAGIAMGGYDTRRGRTENCKILNNTLFQNDQQRFETGELYVQFDTRNNVIKNNLLVAHSQNLFIQNEYTQNTGNVVDHNLYWSPSGAGAGKWRWKNVLYTGWTNYKRTSSSTRSGNDLNGLFVNPVLVSETTPDLHLQPGSPAIDGGDGSVALAVDLDIDGQSRVQGSGVEIGADEMPSAPPVPTPPAAPSGLTATGGIGQVTLRYTDNSNNETGFHLERKPAGDPDSSFVEITVVGAGVTTVIDSVAPGSYGYRVRASNAVGSSGYTNTATGTSSAAPTPPAAPSDLTASGGEGQANLAWTDNSSDETGFKIERKLAAAPDSSFAQIATAGAGATSFGNTGLAAGTYSWRVRATNAAGDSPHSNSAEATVTASPASTVNLLPVADTYTRAGSSAGTNFGTAAVLDVKTGPIATNQRNGYLRFSIGGVGATVTSARLRLWGNAVTSAKATLVHAVADVAWGETSTTYNTPTTGAGGPAMTSPALAQAQTPLAAGWIELDVTAYVQQRRSAGATLVSLGLRTASTEESPNTFHSREGANKPVLVITSQP